MIDNLDVSDRWDGRNKTNDTMAHLKCGVNMKAIVLHPASVILWTIQSLMKRGTCICYIRTLLALSHALNPCLLQAAVIAPCVPPYTVLHWRLSPLGHSH